MEHVGVMHFVPSMADPENLINGLLYFDKLVYAGLDYKLLENFEMLVGNPLTQYLIFESGLIEKYDNEEYFQKQRLNLELLINNQIQSFEDKFKGRSLSETHLPWPILRQITVREDANLLNNIKTEYYTPYFLYDFVSPLLKNKTIESPVLRVIFNKFPSLVPGFDINKFLDFKKDPDTILKLKRLREWTSELTKKDYSQKELQQKLEYLLAEYTRQMEIHSLKFKVSKSQSLVVSTMEFIEGLFSKFSRPVKGLFEIELNRLNLLDAEQKAVGKEVAYIHKVNEVFIHDSSVLK